MMKHRTGKSRWGKHHPHRGRGNYFVHHVLLLVVITLLVVMFIVLHLYVNQVKQIQNNLRFLQEQDRLLCKMNCEVDESIYEVEIENSEYQMIESNPRIIEEHIVQKKRIANLSKKDQEILCRIVEAEASGEDLLGKEMVADVVINRVLDGRFPNSVQAVVFQNADNRFQFSPVADGRFHTVHVSSETKRAVQEAILSEDRTDGALYFVAPRIADRSNLEWFQRSLCLKVRHGLHCFYR